MNKEIDLSVSNYGTTRNLDYSMALLPGAPQSRITCICPT